MKNKVFKIVGAKNRRKNLHKHPGPTFQIRPGPGYFSSNLEISYCENVRKHNVKLSNI